MARQARATICVAVAAGVLKRDAFGDIGRGRRQERGSSRRFRSDCEAFLGGFGLCLDQAER